MNNFEKIPCRKWITEKIDRERKLYSIKLQKRCVELKILYPYSYLKFSGSYQIIFLYNLLNNNYKIIIKSKLMKKKYIIYKYIKIL